MDVRRKMLVVEDEGLIALELEGKLKKSGYAVTALADSSATALAAIERQRPDLVLMDICLKGDVDGIRVAEEIRRKYDLPVMFISGHTDAGTLERARHAEPCGFIVKPFAVVNFQAQIEIALWKHATHQKTRRNEATLSAVLQSLPEALIATDARGDVFLMNATAEQLTGWDFADASGKPLLEVLRIFDEKTRLPIVNPLESVYDNRPLERHSAPYFLFARNHSPVIIEAAFGPSTGMDGEFCGIVVAFRDITERRKAEERGGQLHKMNAISLMATGLAHELSEVRKQIDAPLNDLMHKAKGATLTRLCAIYGGVSYQHLLLEQLAALGKAEPGAAILVNLNEALLSIEPEFRKILGKSRPLILRLEAGIPMVRVDAEGLEKNLLRLVREAREAMPASGSLRVKTGVVTGRNGEQRVQCTVTDSGGPVWQNARGRVFDPYYQSRPGNRNSGMTLALLYHFVALNGGSVEAVETPLERGDGTTFAISFPAADRYLSAAAKPRLMESSQPGGKTMAGCT